MILQAISEDDNEEEPDIVKNIMSLWEKVDVSIMSCELLAWWQSM